jgi:hypothetical protein
MKFPKSKTGKQCITPCYPPNKLYIHPITLESVINKTAPSCAHIPIKKDGEKYSTDECFAPSNELDMKKNNNINYMNIINPDFYFGAKDFLYIIYQIDNYNKFISWLKDNNDETITTKKRVIDAFFESYFDEISIVEDILIKNIIEIFKFYYLEDFFKNINPYIEINNSKINIIKNPSNTSKNNNIERINFIIDKLINIEEIKKFLIKYLDKYKKEKINLEIFKNNYINYLIKKISS